jgi:transmembrane sensor
MCHIYETTKMNRMKTKLPWDLIISKLQHTTSAEDEIIFNDWLVLDDNRQLFQQLEIVWGNIQNKVASYEPDVEYYWKELSARIQKNDSKSLVAEDLEENTKVIPIRKFYRIVAAASIFLAITLSGAYYLGLNSSPQNFTQTYSSLTGKSKVVLPDGTEVWLHSNTTLSYNSNLHSDTREVDMKGEAYFNVTHDAKKPFIVHSNGVDVKVHGTKFNVNSYSTENVLVSLFEGSVSMKTANKDLLLKPGEEGLYNRLNNTLGAHVGDVNFAKSWTNSELHFENKNLRYVCRYLSKWYSVDINVDPKLPDNQSFTFTIRNESLEEIIRIMARVNSIDYQFDENNKLTLKSEKQTTKTPM